ncbi:MAG: sulfatase-like hydrolase/transferase [Myxococcales bacterium]|nr:sulfatase-like hydrolase/transferase [Myxococcales bacterium]
MSALRSIRSAVRDAAELALLVAATLTAIEFAALDRSFFVPTETVARAGAVAAILGKNVALLLPGLIAAAGARVAPRVSRVASWSWTLAVATWVSSDAIVRASTGNDLGFYLSSAFEPEAWRFAGGTEGISTVLDGRGWQIAAAIALPTAALAAQSRLRSRRSVEARSAWAWLGLMAAFATAGPAVQRTLPYSEQFALLSREMVWEWNVGFTARAKEVEDLDEALQALYARHYDRVSASPREAAVELDLPEDSPDVAIVIVDSLRSTMLTPERMPRLSELANRGVRFDAMFSAGNRTPTSLYGLIYGRSAIFTPLSRPKEHAVPWAAAMKRAGYELWFIQAAKMWYQIAPIVRAADFRIHPEIVGKSWKRDSRAVRRIRALLNRPTPTILMALLVSAHHPYSFPARFKAVVPSDDPVAVANGEIPVGCRFEQFRGKVRAPQSRGCRKYVGYYRGVRYLDGLIADLVDSIDLKKTFLLVTGDHGHSFGEDGGFFHGGRLSDSQVRVPAILLGPGLPENRIIDYPTSLADTMASIFALLGVSDAGSLTPGRSWFIPSPRAERSVSIARTSSASPLHTLALVGEEHRYALKIDRNRPEVNFVAKIDGLERSGKPLLEGEYARVIDWFNAFLRRERGP